MSLHYLSVTRRSVIASSGALVLLALTGQSHVRAASTAATGFAAVPAASVLSYANIVGVL
jgi:hypothetical protein